MKDDEEFRKRLVEIKEHFADLIDDETAENLAAYSFGVIPKTELGKFMWKESLIGCILLESSKRMERWAGWPHFF
jgi:hypothetical protein